MRIAARRRVQLPQGERRGGRVPAGEPFFEIDAVGVLIHRIARRLVRQIGIRGCERVLRAPAVVIPRERRRLRPVIFGRVVLPLCLGDFAEPEERARKEIGFGI